VTSDSIVSLYVFSCAASSIQDSSENAASTESFMKHLTTCHKHHNTDLIERLYIQQGFQNISTSPLYVKVSDCLVNS